ncbi:MAG: hypothetical protein LBK18_00150 [Prevotellaceae bacterium]|nr:hypothetical protein [Prevotellaceae bacterium]
MLALGAIMVSASCAKEDPAKALDDSAYTAEGKSATIEGKLLVNNDISILAPLQQKYAAIQGVTVIATISYSSLNPSSGGSGSYSTSTTTSSSGEFTLKVPATANGVSVTLTVNHTQGKQKRIIDYTSANVPITSEINGKWSFSINDYSLLSVKSGQTIILESAIGNFTPIESAGDPVGNYSIL